MGLFGVAHLGAYTFYSLFRCMSYYTETWHNYEIKIYLYPVNNTVIFAGTYWKSATLVILVYFNINHITSIFLTILFFQIIWLVCSRSIILNDQKTGKASQTVKSPYQIWCPIMTPSFLSLVSSIRLYKITHILSWCH